MKILVLGGTGFVGQWVVKKLAAVKPDATIVTASLREGIDLREYAQVERLFARHGPDSVINCAAYVGGIQFGYKFPAELFSNNMRMITNVFEASKASKIGRLVQPISNCAYPAGESYFQEENFWNGPLHESVYVYGMTRKMMVTGAWAYAKEYGLDTISLVLSNMYGPGDHYDVERSHALGAMIKRVVDAKRQGKDTVTLWGTGAPVREWLYVEDGAEALVRGLDAQPTTMLVNVGHGHGISVKELAELIRGIVGWAGNFEFDTSMPDGAPYKTVDGSRGEELLHWAPATPLRVGIERTVDDYLRILPKAFVPVPDKA